MSFFIFFGYFLLVLGLGFIFWILVFFLGLFEDFVYFLGIRVRGVGEGRREDRLGSWGCLECCFWVIGFGEFFSVWRVVYLVSNCCWLFI